MKADEHLHSSTFCSLCGKVLLNSIGAGRDPSLPPESEVPDVAIAHGITKARPRSQFPVVPPDLVDHLLQVGPREPLHAIAHESDRLEEEEDELPEPPLEVPDTQSSMAWANILFGSTDEGEPCASLHPIVGARLGPSGSEASRVNRGSYPSTAPPLTRSGELAAHIMSSHSYSHSERDEHSEQHSEHLEALARQHQQHHDQQQRVSARDAHTHAHSPPHPTPQHQRHNDPQQQHPPPPSSSERRGAGRLKFRSGPGLLDQRAAEEQRYHTAAATNTTTTNNNSSSSSSSNNTNTNNNATNNTATATTTNTTTTTNSSSSSNNNSNSSINRSSGSNDISSSSNNSNNNNTNTNTNNNNNNNNTATTATTTTSSHTQPRQPPPNGTRRTPTTTTSTTTSAPAAPLQSAGDRLSENATASATPSGTATPVVPLVAWGREAPQLELASAVAALTSREGDEVGDGERARSLITPTLAPVDVSLAKRGDRPELGSRFMRTAPQVDRYARGEDRRKAAKEAVEAANAVGDSDTFWRENAIAAKQKSVSERDAQSSIERRRQIIRSLNSAADAALGRTTSNPTTNTGNTPSATNTHTYPTPSQTIATTSAPTKKESTTNSSSTNATNFSPSNGHIEPWQHQQQQHNATEHVKNTPPHHTQQHHHHPQPQPQQHQHQEQQQQHQQQHDHQHQHQHQQQQQQQQLHAQQRPAPQAQRQQQHKPNTNGGAKQPSIPAGTNGASSDSTRVLTKNRYCSSAFFCGSSTPEVDTSDVGTLHDSHHWVATGSGLSRVFVGCEAHFIVERVGQNGGPSEHITCLIKDLIGNSLTNIKLARRERQVDISYVLTRGGEYEVSVLCGSKHVRGSPFPIVVPIGELYNGWLELWTSQYGGWVNRWLSLYAVLDLKGKLSLYSSPPNVDLKVSYLLAHSLEATFDIALKGEAEFSLTSPLENSSLYFRCRSREQRQQWVSALKRLRSSAFVEEDEQPPPPARPRPTPFLSGPGLLRAAVGHPSEILVHPPPPPAWLRGGRDAISPRDIGDPPRAQRDEHSEERAVWAATWPRPREIAVTAIGPTGQPAHTSVRPATSVGDSDGHADGVCVAAYTPAEIGMTCVSVVVRGQHAAGSPFYVDVAMAFDLSIDTRQFL